MSDYVDFLFDPSMPWLVGEEDETFANWCARYPDIDDSTDPLNPGPGMMDYASNSGFDNGTVNHVSSNWSAPANPSSMDNGVNGTTQFWQLVDDQALGQQLGFNTYDFAAPGHSTEPDLGFTTTAAVPNSLTAPGHRSGFPTINSQDEQGGMHQSHAASAPYRAQRPIAPYTGSLQAGAASLSAGDFDSSGFIGGQAHG